MTYKVIIQPEAEQELADAFTWLAENEPTYAPSWRKSLEGAVDSLKQMPRRCAIAPENERFDVELRSLQFGKGKSVYRVIFTIVESEVRILHIRHGHREPLKGTN